MRLAPLEGISTVNSGTVVVALVMTLVVCMTNNFNYNSAGLFYTD